MLKVFVEGISGKKRTSYTLTANEDKVVVINNFTGNKAMSPSINTDILSVSGFDFRLPELICPMLLPDHVLGPSVAEQALRIGRLSIDQGKAFRVDTETETGTTVSLVIRKCDHALIGYSKIQGTRSVTFREAVGVVESFSEGSVSDNVSVQMETNITFTPNFS